MQFRETGEVCTSVLFILFATLSDHADHSYELEKFPIPVYILAKSNYPLELPLTL